jgi:DEAD/DEAH box helicase domain-containing protein
MEHAAIGMFPLIVMTDRNDLGGISIPLHPQLDSAAVFIYDGVPGGAGLSRQAFLRARSLLSVTLKAIQGCACSNGCPSCVHSPKCGSGNRPIDKTAAVFVLQAMQDTRGEQVSKGGADQIPSTGNGLTGVEEATDRSGPMETEETLPAPATRIKPAGSIDTLEKRIKGKAGGRLRKRREARKRRRVVPNKEPAIPQTTPVKSSEIHFGVFDLETQRSAKEVGGWHRADLMKVSCGVLYDSAEDRCIEYLEEQVPELIDHLKDLDCVIGFNSKRFDYNVLKGYTDFDFKRLPSLDILEEVHHHLGYRLSLDNLASATLGSPKSADGLQALKWWKQKRMRELMDYCRKDVEITRDLFLYGRENGYLLFNNKAGHTVRVPVNFAL